MKVAKDPSKNSPRKIDGNLNIARDFDPNKSRKLIQSESKSFRHISEYDLSELSRELNLNKILVDDRSNVQTDQHCNMSNEENEEQKNDQTIECLIGNQN